MREPQTELPPQETAAIFAAIEEAIGRAQAGEAGPSVPLLKLAARAKERRQQFPDEERSYLYEDIARGLLAGFRADHEPGLALRPKVAWKARRY